MVELVINGFTIDLPLKGNEIKYNKQVSDIFDLSKVSSSYTNSFQIPKTQKNTKAFESLGIAGDSSSIPYSKTQVSLLNNGFTLIDKGWLNVSETSNSYKASITDGMIDFFKAIENKTLGGDLDLKNFQHFKDLPTVLASKNNEYYTYIVADYGGNNIGRPFGTVDFRILIDFQVPSFSVRKLFDLVFSTFGFTWHSLRMEEFLNDLWITYPTPPTYVESSGDLIATLNKGFYKSNNFLQVGQKYIIANEQQWTSSTIVEGVLVDNQKYKIPESTGYKINIKVEAYQTFFYFLNNEDKYLPAYVDVMKNGTTFLSFITDPYAVVDRDINVYLNENDIISYIVYSKGTEGSSLGVFVRNIAHNSTEIEIKKINQGQVSPNNAFNNFKITDFFKEILYRTGLVPNINENHITFKHVSETIDFGNAVNWSDKYITRRKETYIKSSYAQRNLFKMKYNDEQVPFNDGVLLVNNANIDDEKTLAQSVFYSPEKEQSSILKRNAEEVFVPVLKMYKAEIKEVNNEMETNYKPLDSHFYLLRKKNIVGDFGFISYEIPAEEVVDDWNFASIENTVLSQLVSENFTDYEKIFTNFRCHEIELKLSLLDVMELDFSKPIFFEKESAYYILNKISFQDGETTIGEFLKINK